VSVLLLVSSELPEVELELLALQDVTISTAGLTRSAGNGSVKTTSSELGLEERVDFGIFLPIVQAALSVVGELLGFSAGLDRGLALFCYGLSVMGLIPLPEGGGIDLDDSALDKGVGSDKFIVGGVVCDTN